MPDFALNKPVSAQPVRWACAIATLMLTACSTGIEPATGPQTTPQIQTAPAERDIVDVAWMSGDFSREITEAVTCQDIGVLVTTRGYAEGEEINVTVGEKHGSTEHDVTLYGKVDADGQARIPWPAMGCVENMPTPLLGGSAEPAPAVDAPRPSKKRGAQKAASGKPSHLSPRKEKSTPFDDPATMIDPPRSTAP